MRSGGSAADFAIGVGTATKITFLATALIFAPAAFQSVRNRNWRPPAFLVVSAAFAFAAFAPYALLHYDVYLAGLQTLQDQYSSSGGEDPHLSPDPGVLYQARWFGAFFGILYGPVLIFGVVAPVLFRRATKPVILGLWLSSLVPVAYFLTKHVFFERNLSLPVMGFLIIAAWRLGGVLRPAIAIVLCLLALAPMAYWSAEISSASADRDRLGPWRSQRGFSDAEEVWLPADRIPTELPVCSGAFGLIDYGDPYSVASRATLRRLGYAEIGHYKSRFAILPTSTLQTYLDYGVFFFACKPGTPPPR